MSFEPGEPVVVRNNKGDVWRFNIFSHMTDINRFQCVFDTWSFCLPFNEETKHLIGTTNAPEQQEIFEFGDHVEVSDNNKQWEEAIYIRKSRDEDYIHCAVPRPLLDYSTCFSHFKFCRKAKW